VARRRVWSDTRIVDSVAGSQFIKKDLFATLSSVQDVKTVVRLVIDVMVTILPTEAADGVMATDLAIGVTSQEAFVAETLPDPNAVNDYPLGGWLYIATRSVGHFESAGGVMMQTAVYTADIRAMRKVDRGVLFAYYDSVLLSGVSISTLWCGRIRALCLT